MIKVRHLSIKEYHVQKWQRKFCRRRSRLAQKNCHGDQFFKSSLYRDFLFAKIYLATSRFRMLICPIVTITMMTAYAYFDVIVMVAGFPYKLIFSTYIIVHAMDKKIVKIFVNMNLS